jgi:co-chaperonin GroES (HSP10)
MGKNNVAIPKMRLIDDRVLLHLEAEADGFSDAPSLIKPEGVKPDHVYRIGRIVGLGPGKLSLKTGKLIPLGVELGTRVLFVKFLATHTDTGKKVAGVLGKDFAIVQTKDLLLELGEDVSISSICQ